MYEKFGQFIDGKWCQSSDKSTYEVINPANEEVIGHASKATAQDVDRALKSAEKGLEVWKKTAPWQRSYIIRRIADKMREKQDVLAKWMTLEVGKPFAEAKGEVGGAADIFEWNAEETKRIYGQTVESRFEDTRVHVYYQPVGVVAALTPWNFPAVLSARKISTALAAGCSVIVKPDVITPGIVMEMVDICRECGVPPGVVNLLSGDPPSIAQQLIASDIVKKISITGSSRVGKLILKQAADKVQRVTMELSGHSPFIVFDDADIENAVNCSIAGIFGATGQSCVAGSRLYLQENIADEFLSSIIKQAKNIKIGDPLLDETQMGPLCTKGQLENIKTELAFAVEEGATLLCGGKSPEGLGELFFEPTIVDCPSQKLKIVDTELFGPVLSVIKFKTE